MNGWRTSFGINGRGERRAFLLSKRVCGWVLGPWPWKREKVLARSCTSLNSGEFSYGDPAQAARKGNRSG
jgi:hypothetical protein